MCGIVGILGRGPVAEQLVDSLKRLEYRGYDSAGVATLEGDHLDRRRAEGSNQNPPCRRVHLLIPYFLIREKTRSRFDHFYHDLRSLQHEILTVPG